MSRDLDLALVSELERLKRRVEALEVQEPKMSEIYTLDGGELTIASGAITVDRHSWYDVDTEGDAASDDLDTINGGVKGKLLILRAASSARTVVCKDGTGNLSLAGDFSLDNGRDTIMLKFGDPNWIELSRSDNGA